MNTNSNNSEDLFKNLPKYEVSEEKNSEILKSIENARNKKRPLITTLFLTPFTMSKMAKLAGVLVALALIAAVGLTSPMFGQSAYAAHLEKAQNALEQLHELTAQGSDADAEQIKALVGEIMNELEEAQKAVNEIDNEDEMSDAQEAVDELSDEYEATVSEMEDEDADENEDIEEHEGEETQERVEAQERTETQERVEAQESEEAHETVKARESEDDHESFEAQEADEADEADEVE